MRANRVILGLALAIIFLLAAPLGAQETLPPVGTVTISYGQISAGVGVSWGDGTLTYQGKTYPFRIRGLQIAAVGISKVNAVGEVYRMTRPSDFYGKYAAAEAGYSPGRGRRRPDHEKPERRGHEPPGHQPGGAVESGRGGPEHRTQIKGGASLTAAKKSAGTRSRRYFFLGKVFQPQNLDDI
jgi:hypothetical protein